MGIDSKNSNGDEAPVEPKLGEEMEKRGGIQSREEIGAFLGRQQWIPEITCQECGAVGGNPRMASMCRGSGSGGLQAWLNASTQLVAGHGSLSLGKWNIETKEGVYPQDGEEYRYSPTYKFVQ